MRIRTKAESVQLYESGFFGNKGLTWQSVQDYYRSGFEDFVVLRYRDKGFGGGPCLYNLCGDFEVYQAVKLLAAQGFAESRMWINAQMPDYAVVVQGEYLVGDDGGVPEDVFFCSTEKRQMRPALDSTGRHIGRLAAMDLLQRSLDYDSWSNFLWLRETFPGHVIEISVYSQPVGLLGWNSVVWEVRSY